MYTNFYRTLLQALIKLTQHNICVCPSFSSRFLLKTHTAFSMFPILDTNLCILMLESLNLETVNFFNGSIISSFYKVYYITWIHSLADRNALFASKVTTQSFFSLWYTLGCLPTFRFIFLIKVIQYTANIYRMVISNFICNPLST